MYLNSIAQSVLTKLLPGKTKAKITKICVNMNEPVGLFKRTEQGERYIWVEGLELTILGVK